MSASSTRENGDCAVGAVIVIQGAFVAKHRVELLELVRTTECLAFLADATQQIESLTDESDRLTIKATSTSLIERIGERLCAVCGGTVKSLPPIHGESRARFTWTRNEDLRS